jgi:hypothetical protein
MASLCMISVVLSTAAQAAGFPPNVEITRSKLSREPNAPDHTSSLVTATLTGTTQEPRDFESVTMSGVTPSCSMANILPVRIVPHRIAPSVEGTCHRAVAAEE